MKKLFLSVVCAVFACFAARAQNTAYRLSTHILDIGTGMPAPNVAVKLLRQSAGGEWTEIADGITDSNGRIADFLPSDQNNSGIFKLRFATSDYFARQKQNSVYPYIEVVLKIENNDRHYHIPITVSANGYSTYLGN